MNFIKHFESFQNSDLNDILIKEYPIKFDKGYKDVIGLKRYYIVIDDKPRYFSFDENGNPDYGFNEVKQKLVNVLTNEDKIKDLVEDTRTIKKYLKSVLD